MNFANDRQPNSASTKKDRTPKEFFNELYHLFQKSYDISEKHEQSYRIGETIVRLRFAGSTLIPYLTPALSHLKTDSFSNADLAICLWESKSTGSRGPNFPANRINLSEEGFTFNDDRYQIIYQPVEHTLNALDMENNMGLFWVRDAAGLPFWVKGAPLINVLYLWMKKNGLQLIHSASVGTKNNGVLIAGKGGSGKSTAALSCTLAGFDYVGDDYILLGMKPNPHVYSLYNSGKLDKNQIKQFPELVRHISNHSSDSEEKALIFLNEYYRERVQVKLPVRAILIPKITNTQTTQIVNASPMDAMMALAPSTIYQMPYAKQDVLTYLKEFVKTVPGYYLELGTDIHSIPNVIERFLSDSKIT